ncbi:MalY/PatB family protein [Amphritea sp.]|uniref:MalY/PatB family protein n=1 Tax=Amphritea sp. TaxID=1872502 RepID=UPI003A93B93B
MNFDQNNTGTENNFIRKSPEMLTSIFGTTEVTPLWVADMDFTVANPIKAELQRLVDRGQFAYEFNSKGVFNAISNWYQRRHGLDLNTSNFVQVTGVLTGIALLIRELTNQDDSVLIQTPAYHQFSKVISSAGRNVVKSPLKIVGGKYEIDFDDLDTKLRAVDVKVMILCNPHNPVGRVWSKEELETVLQIAARHNVTIISDEIHADIIYSGHRFTSLMKLDSKNHVALIGSPSKTFGMQSISNGYIYTANQSILESMRAAAESMYLDHGNAFTTFSTIAAYEKGEEWVDELLVYLQSNRDWISDFVANELPGVSMFPIEGTYQGWLDFSATGLSGDDLTTIFGKSGFGASPGTWFDQDANLFARVNFAVPRADIKAAFKRLQTVLIQPNSLQERDTKANAKCCC